jgi:hypothetical protein
VIRTIHTHIMAPKARQPRSEYCKRYPPLLLWSAGLLTLALFLSACRDQCPLRPCTPNRVSGIWLRVVDSNTGLDAACGATTWIQDGAYAETLQAYGCDLPDSLRTAYMVAAEERVGTYEAFVQKAGYQAWHRSGIRVRRRECDCHVETVKIVAHLVPIGPNQLAQATTGNTRRGILGGRITSACTSQPLRGCW